MTDKEKLEAISAEIHRLVDVRGYDREMANDLFAFMDSLPNEPISEELDEVAKHYLYSNILYDDVYVGNPTDKDCIEMFKAGANWQLNKMKEDAIETSVMAAFAIGLHIEVKLDPNKYSFGDKVKLVIIKED